MIAADRHRVVKESSVLPGSREFSHSRKPCEDNSPGRMWSPVENFACKGHSWRGLIVYLPQTVCSPGGDSESALGVYNRKAVCGLDRACPVEIYSPFHRALRVPSLEIREGDNPQPTAPLLCCAVTVTGFPERVGGCSVAHAIQPHHPLLRLFLSRKCFVEFYRCWRRGIFRAIRFRA